MPRNAVTPAKPAKSNAAKGRRSAKSRNTVTKAGTHVEPANLEKPALPVSPMAIPLRAASHTRALALSAVFVTAAALTVAAAWRQPSQPAAPPLDVPFEDAVAAPDPVRRTTQEPGPITPAATGATAARPATVVSALKPAVVTSVSETARIAPLDAGAPAQEPEPDTITITGCLEGDDGEFRLTDTAGEDAPRARSWKAGFLRRSNRSVDVVDAVDRLRLANHVGERVSATGTLADGDMQLRSLRRLAATCDEDA